MLDDLDERAEVLGTEHINAEEHDLASALRAYRPLAELGGLPVDQLAPLAEQLAAIQEEEPAAVVSLLPGDDQDVGRLGRALEVLVPAYDRAAQALGKRLPPERNLRELQPRNRELVAVLRARSGEPAVAWRRIRRLVSMLPDSYAPYTPLHAEQQEEQDVDRGSGLRIRPSGFDERAVSEIRKAGRRTAADFPDFVYGVITEMDAAASQVLAHLAAEIGRVRSHLELVQRFAFRARAYDRTRLIAMADGEQAKGRREAALRDEFARFLFDEGLQPLTEASLATTRADILEISGPSTLLVEAKQYTGGSAAALTTLIQKAFLQALDTAAEIPPAARPTEVFLVIFRRRGRRISLSEPPVRVGDLDVYLRLIDISDPEETGSGASGELVTLSENDLLTRLDAAITTPETVRATPDPPEASDADEDSLEHGL
ncbi:MAG: hypothetical protein WBP81_09335 [Solirubrobacteraceae bacterium]